MFIGKLFEHRPSYHLLGVLLFIQLGVTSAAWAIRNVMRSPLVYGNAARNETEADMSSNSKVHGEQKALVLEVSIYTSSVLNLFHLGYAVLYVICGACQPCLQTKICLLLLSIVPA